MFIFNKLLAKIKLKLNPKHETTATIAIGNRVENWVKKALILKGLKPICQNFRSKFGEIDLIMQHKEIIVFVEVRYRKNQSYGSGAESVTYSKQRKIINTAHYFLATKANLLNKPCRFDIVTVTGAPEKLKMSWIVAAFEVE